MGYGKEKDSDKDMAIFVIRPYLYLYDYLKLFAKNSNTLDGDDAEVVFLERVDVRYACDAAILGRFVYAAVG